MIIAFFDFDGTITSKDSMVLFLQYIVGKPKYYLGLLVLSPLLFLYKCKLIKNDVAKEKLLSYFLKGWDVKELTTLADNFAMTEIDKIIRPLAKEKINWHQAEGHKVVIVSASINIWLLKWCEKNKIELLATCLEYKNGKISGNFSSKNCYGMEKVNRIKSKYVLDDYQYIYAYGDSSGDTEMLKIADSSHYKPFN